MKRRGQLCEAWRRSKSDKGNRECKGPEVRKSVTVSGHVGRPLWRKGIIMPAPKVVEVISEMIYVQHLARWLAHSRGTMNISPFSLCGGGCLPNSLRLRQPQPQTLRRSEGGDGWWRKDLPVAEDRGLALG